MHPCPLCGHKSHTALILTYAVLIVLLTSAGWVWMRGSDVRDQEEITQLRERISSLESRGQGTVHFHFPEVKSVYNNFDQKGFDLVLPTPVVDGKTPPKAVKGKP